METRLVPLFRRLTQAVLVLSVCFFTFLAAKSQQHYEATLDSLNQHPLPQWYARRSSWESSFTGVSIQFQAGAPSCTLNTTSKRLTTSRTTRMPSGI